MKLGRLVLAAALAIGIGGAASATPLAPEAAQVLDHPGVLADYTKGGKHGWKGGKGHHFGYYKAPRRHYGWYRGHHHGWYRPHRRVYYAAPRRHYRPHRVYYAPPRRHYGWRRGHHYGWYQHRRPARGVYFRF